MTWVKVDNGDEDTAAYNLDHVHRIELVVDPADHLKAYVRLRFVPGCGADVLLYESTVDATKSMFHRILRNLPQ